MKAFTKYESNISEYKAPPEDLSVPGKHRRELVEVQDVINGATKVVEGIKGLDKRLINFPHVPFGSSADEPGSNDTLFALVLHYAAKEEQLGLGEKHIMSARRSDGTLVANCIQYPLENLGLPNFDKCLKMDAHPMH